LLFFLFEKGLTDRVLVKGNCVDSGPSVVVETLSWLLLRNKDRLPDAKYYYIVSYNFSSFIFRSSSSCWRTPKFC